MTTVSARSRLSSSLASKHDVSASAVAEGVDAFEDEEIASVEADGTGEVDGAAGAEKRMLTAALVTSVVESAGAVAAAGRGGRRKVGPAPASSAPPRRSTRKRKAADDSEFVAEATKPNKLPARRVAANGMRAAVAPPPPSPRRAGKVKAAAKATPLRNNRKRPAATGAATAGASSSSSSVPNPLAAAAPPPASARPMSVLRPGAADALMSAAPGAAPQPTPPAGGGGHDFADVAEGMSFRRFRADGVASTAGVGEAEGTDERGEEGDAAAASSQAPAQPQPQGRGRIFSVDLDPAVLDFVENIVDQPHNSTVTFKDGPDDAPSGRTSSRAQRDRGFSFEFFSFGIDGEEPLPPVQEHGVPPLARPRGDSIAEGACLVDAMRPRGDSVAEGVRLVEGMRSRGNSIADGNARPRGDSIIFDPASFCEGGIHETSALVRVEQGQGSEQQVREAPSAIPPQGHIRASPTVKPVHTPSTQIQPFAPAGPASIGTSKIPPMPPSRRIASSHPKARAKSSAHRRTAPASSKASGGVSEPFLDTTIQMPHGSAAAAAATAGMSREATTSSSSLSSGVVTATAEGTSASHTACPMDLLNKDGRIGIYLPEERRARIAKFHEKRTARIWRKRIKYDCRKKLADSRPRIKGRFVKQSDVGDGP